MLVFFLTEASGFVEWKVADKGRVGVVSIHAYAVFLCVCLYFLKLILQYFVFLGKFKLNAVLRNKRLKPLKAVLVGRRRRKCADVGF